MWPWVGTSKQGVGIFMSETLGIIQIYTVFLQLMMNVDAAFHSHTLDNIVFFFQTSYLYCVCL